MTWSQAAKWFLVVIAVQVIAVYLLDLSKQPPGQHGGETRHGTCAQAGVRNHSGVELWDPSGLCKSAQGRDYSGGRDLLEEGRD
jgi:hypothetical protein